MKRVISIQPASTDAMLFILRIGVGALMLTHGIPKLMMLIGNDPIQFPPLMGLNSETSLMLAVGAEVFCSLLIISGTATRLAVIPLIITMLVAAFMIHGADSFTKKEPALFYLLVYTALLIGGSGRLSVDYALLRKFGKKQSWYELSA